MRPNDETPEAPEKVRARLAGLAGKAPIEALDTLARSYARRATGVFSEPAHRNRKGTVVDVPQWMDGYLRSGGSADDGAKVLDWAWRQEKVASDQIDSTYRRASMAAWQSGALSAAVGPFVAGMIGGLAGTASGLGGTVATVTAAGAAALWAAYARGTDDAMAFDRETRWAPRSLENANDYRQDEFKAAAAWRSGRLRPSAWHAGQAAWDAGDGGGAYARWWAAHAIVGCVWSWPVVQDARQAKFDELRDAAFAHEGARFADAPRRTQLQVLRQLREEDDEFARASMLRALTDTREAALTALTWHAVTYREEPLWTAYEGETWMRERAHAERAFYEAETELREDLSAAASR